jgi:alkylhydroperoxidase/carboxymuconolactone decarboxylase family protein YurZ
MPDQSVGSFERGSRLLEKMLGAGEARRMRAAWRRLEPDFERYVLTFVAGEVWSRPGLDRRTRSLCTIAALAALGRTNGLALNVRMALRNGASRSEIVEVLLHIAVYAGFPAAWEALALAGSVFSEGSQGKRRQRRVSRRIPRGAQ